MLKVDKRMFQKNLSTFHYSEKTKLILWGCRKKGSIENTFESLIFEQKKISIRLPQFSKRLSLISFQCMIIAMFINCKNYLTPLLIFLLLVHSHNILVKHTKFPILPRIKTSTQDKLVNYYHYNSFTAIVCLFMQQS